MKPKKIRKEILKQLHSGHQGITKYKERACCSVWWPEITSDIEEYNKACQICCQYQKQRFELGLQRIVILYLGYPDGVSNRISGYILVFLNKLIFNNNYFSFYYHENE